MILTKRRQRFAKLFIPLCVYGCFALSNAHGQQAAKQNAWPHPVPCRVEDGANDDLLFMTLGDVNTPVATGVFDPVKDEVKLKDGKTIPNYYKDVLDIAYYQPIDKTHFPLPPSGWCSWYYYYQEINEDEVMRNARWIHDHLQDFGARYVQLDDGWQGVGHGNATNRDWNVIDRRFSGGMDKLAADIKALGLTPGLWLAPHGHSDSNFVKKNPKVFLLKPDGTSASDTWEGKFLIDPTTKQAHAYLKDLFTRMSDWGYEYFKIDGQPIVTREYRNKKEFMRRPQDDTNELYRNTLRTMKEAIGDERYLLGCWVVPLEGVGIMNGSRTSADVLLDWRGVMTALRSTMQYYFLHNVAWYSDPDVLLVRSPLPMEQARAWATVMGLSGQALMSSDRLMDLSPDRVELLRRVYPATDIRPLDLFPATKNKRIWDLKIDHLGRRYDVAGLFNYKTDEPENLYVSWKELGLSDASRVHVFDFWNREYLGAWQKGVSIQLEPASCRVLTLLPDNGHIQLISTSRHITQGWVDLAKIAFDRDGKQYRGASRVVKNDPYEVRFAFPQGKNYRISKAEARTGSGNLPVEISNHDGWATARFTSPENTEVQWQVTFEEASMYSMPVREPDKVWIEPAGLYEADVRWTPRLQTVTGYKVFLNGEELGFTPGCSFRLNALDREAVYKVGIETQWLDGTGSKERASAEFSLRALNSGGIYLSLTEPSQLGGGWRQPSFDRTVSGKAIELDGQKYAHGVGVPSGSEVAYNLRGKFGKFTALVGIDDQNGRDGEVEFIVHGDGKELWRSGMVSKNDDAKKISLDIRHVDRLTLSVKRGPKGASGDEANWADAMIE